MTDKPSVKPAQTKVLTINMSINTMQIALKSIFQTCCPKNDKSN